jgi:CheY-like chemotaxis protein
MKPLPPWHATHEGPPSSRGPKTSAPSGPGVESAASRRVLVVEDNADSADLMRMILELRGHVAMAVYDGQAALELIETFAPDVVLLDIGLPDIDGYELATRLRQRPNALHARLVAVTGWGQGVDHARSREHGFVAHLTKPVDAAVVLEIIGAVPPRGDNTYRA